MTGYLAALVFVVLAETGDKTQLTTVALASRCGQILQMWLGTTSGMIVADAIGIIVSIVMGRNIPERAVKWFAAPIFIVFGLVSLYEVAPVSLKTVPIAAGSIALIGILLAAARLTSRCTGERDRGPGRVCSE